MSIVWVAPRGVDDRDEPDLALRELLVLEPDGLAIVARLVLPEPSIARLSAAGHDVYVVGDTSLVRVRWDGTALHLDDAFTARYRTLAGQTCGWDGALAAGGAWFLDDGDGSERCSGTLRGSGLSTAPLHLVRVDLATGEVTMAAVCGRPGGLIANPPVVERSSWHRGRLRQRQRLADTGGGVQSVLFPTPGTERDFYVCTFLTVSRVAAR